MNLPHGQERSAGVGCREESGDSSRHSLSHRMQAILRYEPQKGQ